MNRAPQPGGAAAPSNIVRLPTAAPRKVDNYRFAEQRRAVREARANCRWPSMTALEREKRAESRMLGIARTPETLLLLCLLKHSAPEVRAAILQEVGRTWLVLPDDQAAFQAYSIASRLCGDGK